jgi:predicted MPP superfamily phosphohydrolase
MSEPVLTRRQFLKRSFAKWLGLGLLSITGFYSYAIETKWIEIEKLSLTIPHLPDAFQNLRIVHFSDLHIGLSYDPEDLPTVLDQIQALNPDILCFTGDLVTDDTSMLPATVPFFKKLQAPFGKFAVLGNHDYRHSAENVMKCLQQSGFHVLLNSHQIIEKDGSRLAIVGVDDQVEGVPDLEKAWHQQQNIATILLSHCPDFADIAAKYPIALQLSGHSHGGQVRLPLIGHIVTPPFAKKYVQGLYSVPQSSLQVYVNRGLGTTLLPIRFYCRPQISVIELTSR